MTDREVLMHHFWKGFCPDKTSAFWLGFIAAIYFMCALVVAFKWLFFS